MEKDNKDGDTEEAATGGVSNTVTSRHETSWLRSKSETARYGSGMPGITVVDETVFRKDAFIYLCQVNLQAEAGISW